MRAFGGRCKQFVLCSSAIVYGGKMPSSVMGVAQACRSAGDKAA